jgi:transcription elongation factor GreB
MNLHELIIHNSERGVQMSKAFVNEDAGADDDLDNDLLDDAEDDGAAKPSVPKGAKNYITQKGMDVLKAELHELLTVERPKLVETVAWAASNGDRSENADYIYGKRRLREIDRRMRYLQKRLDIAEVVDPVQQKGDKVLFGATVTVLDENEKERVYKIVGVDETDAKTGKVSWISPIGQALLQAKEGDAVTLKTPKGEEGLEILKIQFIAID